MYIDNIYNLRTRILNKVSRGLVNDFTELDITNSMILSSVAKEKVNDKQSYINLIKYGQTNSFVSWSERTTKNYLCNIQQIKKQYTSIIFLIYFSDQVAIYQLNKEDLHNLPNLCKYQHADNNNEKQFIVNKNNIKHLEFYRIGNIIYDEVIS